jgi:hypothetical protein
MSALTTVRSRLALSQGAVVIPAACASPSTCKASVLLHIQILVSQPALRVALDGAGRSGGFRTLLLYKIGGHAFFAYGFAKSKKGNIDDRELEALKAAARAYAGLSAKQIEAAVATSELIEVSDEDHEGK